MMRICCEECGISRDDVYLLAADNGNPPDPFCCEVIINEDRADIQSQMGDAEYFGGANG